jgi:hypothetical protein
MIRQIGPIKKQLYRRARTGDVPFVDLDVMALSGHSVRNETHHFFYIPRIIESITATPGLHTGRFER